MAHDPRAAQVATKFVQVLNEIQALGNQGFALLLDTADKDEVDDLSTSADVLLDSIARVKHLLALRARSG